MATITFHANGFDAAGVGEADLITHNDGSGLGFLAIALVYPFPLISGKIVLGSLTGMEQVQMATSYRTQNMVQQLP